MPFYLRKSVSVGPFRFNLSKSGVGISAGVTGFRVGTGPRGSYIHVGRGGLYYRTSLNPAGRSGPRREAPSFAPQAAAPAVALQEVETGDILQMVDADAGKILDQINEKLGTVPIWPFVAGLGAAAAALLWRQYPASAPYVGVLGLATLALTILAFWRDNIRRKVVLLYDLDDTAAAAFERLTRALDAIRSAARVWNIDAHGDTNDWKRNAGATRLMKRQVALVEYTTPKVVETNVSVPAVIGGRQRLYFFPDLLLVMEGNKAGGMKYSDLSIDAAATRFIEDERPPADARIIDYTWQYVNKAGGPDRRFANNREIPVCLYQAVRIYSSSGLRKLLHLSRLGDEGERLRRAVVELARAAALDVPDKGAASRTAPRGSEPQRRSAQLTARMPALADLGPFLRPLGGEHGSATERQLAAVRTLDMGEPEGLSLEQAGALLSARSYAEGVLYRLIGTIDGYPGERFVEAHLVEFIVRDAELLNRVLAWNRRSYARGGGAIPSPQRDAHYERVEREAQRLLNIVS